MIRYAVTLAMAFIVAGCATYPPAPADTDNGPKAILEDSAKTHSRSKADFFVAEEMDGTAIEDSVLATLRTNRGRGLAMSPVIISRPIAAGKVLKVALRARTHFAAPILALGGTAYQVKGVVEFVPQENGRYAVRGELGDDYSAIWIEDVATGQPVAPKVVAKGSAKLGFFER